MHGLSEGSEDRDPATPAICKGVIPKGLREEQFVTGGSKGVTAQWKMEGD